MTSITISLLKEGGLLVEAPGFAVTDIRFQGGHCRDDANLAFRIRQPAFCRPIQRLDGKIGSFSTDFKIVSDDGGILSTNLDQAKAFSTHSYTPKFLNPRAHGSSASFETDSSKNLRSLSSKSKISILQSKILLAPLAGF